MRKGVFVVLDAVVAMGTVQTQPVYSAVQHSAQIAAHDAFAVQVIMDRFATPGITTNLWIAIDTSIDGLNWLERTGFGIPIPSGQTSTITQMWSSAFKGVSDQGPLHGFVLFRLYFDNANVAARTQLLVTSRE